MRRPIAIALAASLLAASALAARADTLKLAIPQKGNWDTSFAEIGVHQGFFKQQGIDLDITYTEGGANTEQALVSGSVDLAVATGTLGMISAYVKGAPVRIIAAQVTGVPDIFWYTRADSGIKTIKDVAGKTISFSAPGSSSNLALIELLKQNGVEGAKMVPTGGTPPTLTLVMSGQIDVGWSAPMTGLREIKDGKARVVAWGHDIKALQHETIRVNAVNLNSLQKNRDAIVRFAKAYDKSFEFAYSNPEAVTWFADQNHVPRDIAETAVKQYYSKEANSPYKISGIQDVLDQAYEAKRLSKPMKAADIKDLFDIVWKPGQ